MKKITCFKAYDIRGKLGEELNNDVAYRIGYAFAKKLNAKKVVVGGDIRQTSESLKVALAHGLMDAGAEVIDIGMVGTEEIYFASFYLDVDGGIEVTASHNPLDYNGMKLVGKGAKPISGDSGLHDIQRLAETIDSPYGESAMASEVRHFVDHLDPRLDRHGLLPRDDDLNTVNDHYDGESSESPFAQTSNVTASEAKQSSSVENGGGLTATDSGLVATGVGNAENTSTVIASEAKQSSQYQQKSILAPYVEHLLTYINLQSFKTLKLVVNAGNGAAGHVIDAIEKQLLNRQIPVEFIKVHHQPDGSFPNGIPNPLLPENRAATADAVKANQADIGIAWDGDFDRCFLFDENGRFIEGYYIVGLLAEAFLRKSPGEKIIHDPRLIWNTIDQVSAAGGIAIQSKTGHAFIKERMRLENAAYGGEMSAHHYFRDFAYCDSGMIPWLLVAELISISGSSLSELVNLRMQAYPCSGEINYRVDNVPATLDRIVSFYTNINSDQALDRHGQWPRDDESKDSDGKNTVISSDVKQSSSDSRQGGWNATASGLAVTEDNDSLVAVEENKSHSLTANFEFDDYPIIDKTDGISLMFANWRFNLRASNTEPLLRLNVESRGDVDLVWSKVSEIEALING